MIMNENVESIEEVSEDISGMVENSTETLEVNVETFETSYVYSMIESFLNDVKILYKLNEIKNDFYAIVNTFTFGELAIFIMLFVFYLTYLLFKFWSVFR